MPAERGIRTCGAITRRAKKRPKQGYETVVPPALALQGRVVQAIGKQGERLACGCLSHLLGAVSQYVHTVHGQVGPPKVS
jgi:hypothetical protein